jgi:plasmid stability protein
VKADDESRQRQIWFGVIIVKEGVMASLTIHLPDEQKTALAEKARVHGLSAEEYARQVIERDIAPEWLQKSWREAKESGADRLSMEEIDAEIAAARKARRGVPGQPDL